MNTVQSSLWKKLMYKGQSPLLLMGLPEELSQALVFPVEAEVETVPQREAYGFLLCFSEMVANLAPVVEASAGRLEGDAVYWIAYPKKSSRRYRSDLHRDHEAWKILGKLGMEPVGSVALDDDWSALRFRKVQYIKKITRDSGWIMSEEGRQKQAGNS